MRFLCRLGSHRWINVVSSVTARRWQMCVWCERTRAHDPVKRRMAKRAR